MIFFTFFRGREYEWFRSVKSWMLIPYRWEHQSDKHQCHVKQFRIGRKAVVTTENTTQTMQYRLQTICHLCIIMQRKQFMRIVDPVHAIHVCDESNRILWIDSNPDDCKAKSDRITKKWLTKNFIFDNESALFLDQQSHICVSGIFLMNVKVPKWMEYYILARNKPSSRCLLVKKDSGHNGALSLV